MVKSVGLLGELAKLARGAGQLSKYLELDIESSASMAVLGIPLAEAGTVGKDFDAALTVFAADGDGSKYAIWHLKKGAPVVYMNSEGDGSNVLAGSLEEFIGLMLLDRSELGQFYMLEPEADEEAAEGHDKLLRWAAKRKLVPAQAPKKLVAVARRKYPGFPVWLRKQIKDLRSAQEKTKKSAPRVTRMPEWRAGAKLQEKSLATLWLDGRIEQGELASALAAFLQGFQAAFPKGAIKGEHVGYEGKVLKRFSGAAVPKTADNILRKLKDYQELRLSLHLPGSKREYDSHVSVAYPSGDVWSVISQYIEVPRSKTPLRRVAELLFAAVSHRMFIQECGINPQ